MAEAITYIQSFAINDGPTMATGSAFPAGAYDVLSIPLNRNTNYSVTLQPGTAAKLLGLLIKSNYYTNVSWTPGSVIIPLDAPQMYLGVGQCSLLGITDDTITLHNSNLAIDVVVDILVLRNPV